MSFVDEEIQNERCSISSNVSVILDHCDEEKAKPEISLRSNPDLWSQGLGYNLEIDTSS